MLNRIKNIWTQHPLTGKAYGHYLGDPIGTVALGSYIKRNPTAAYNLGMTAMSAASGNYYGSAYYGAQYLRGRRGTIRRGRRNRYLGTQWRRPRRRYKNYYGRRSYRNRFGYKSQQRLRRFHKTKQRYRKSKFNKCN